MSTYEKYMLNKNVNYVIYYLLVGTIVLIIEELLFWLSGESSFLPFRILVIYWGFTLLPIVLIYFSHRFQFFLSKTKSFLIPPNITDYELWVNEKHDDIFSFKSRLIRFSVLILTTAIVITILIFPKLYSAIFPNILIYILIAIATFVGAHGVYFVYSSLYFLSYFIQYPMKIPFFIMERQEIKYIQSFYFSTALIVLVCYFYLILMASFFPFTLSGPVLFWLSVLGFCPLILFLWSYFQIHVLMMRIKQNSVDFCSAKIEMVTKELESELTTDNLDKLSKLMETQSKVEKLPVWPINVSSSITFIVTLVLPLASFAFDIFKK